MLKTNYNLKVMFSEKMLKTCKFNKIKIIVRQIIKI